MVEKTQSKKDKPTGSILSDEKVLFLDAYKELRDDVAVFTKLAIAPNDLRMWLRTDPEFRKQYESYKNEAKHKLRAFIIEKAFEGLTSVEYINGDLVKELKKQDTSMIKLAYQIVNGDDFDQVKNYLPDEIKVKFI